VRSNGLVEVTFTIIIPEIKRYHWYCRWWCQPVNGFCFRVFSHIQNNMWFRKSCKGSQLWTIRERLTKDIKKIDSLPFTMMMMQIWLTHDSRWTPNEFLSHQNRMFWKLLLKFDVPLILREKLIINHGTVMTQNGKWLIIERRNNGSVMYSQWGWKFQWTLQGIPEQVVFPKTLSWPQMISQKFWLLWLRECYSERMSELMKLSIQPLLPSSQKMCIVIITGFSQEIESISRCRFVDNRTICRSHRLLSATKRIQSMKQMNKV
jgi:hypothetical protein